MAHLSSCWVRLHSFMKESEAIWHKSPHRLRFASLRFDTLESVLQFALKV